MFGFLARVLRVYRGHRLVASTVLFLMLVAQIVAMSRPAFIGGIVDNLRSAIDSGGQGDRELLTLVVLLVASFPLMILLKLGREQLEVWKLDSDMKRSVQQWTLERLFRLSPGQHTSENSGLKLSVVNKGQHALASLAFLVVYEAVPLFLEMGVLSAAMFYTDWRSGAVICVGISVFCLGSVIINKPMIPKLRQNEKLFHRHGQFYSEIIRNLPLTQYFAAEGRMLRDCDRSIIRVHEYAKPMWGTYLWQFALMRLAVLTTTLVGFIVMLFQSAFSGRISLGVTVTMFMWGITVIQQINGFAPVQRRYLSMRAAIEKYFGMLDMEPDVRESEHPVILERIKGKIEFRGVGFVYQAREDSLTDLDTVSEPGNKAQDSLCDVSFTIYPGEKVAIVGPSGAGKSTVVKLLLRGMDVSEGAVLVDDIDVRQLGLKQLRGSIGLVDQDVSLFDNTLRYNMSLSLDAVGKAQDGDLDRVSRLSRMSEFWDRMEFGYDTIIGERGIQLSGGQRQRVGIARAIMGDPSMLVFDEATSSLDAENEQAIANALDDISAGRTTIIIAHRFSTIKRAEKVIVMDRGRVVDIGTHTQLEQRCEVYQRLLENQRL